MLSLTFDIDWAPDWAVWQCAEICQRADVAATFFVTHAADVLKDLDADSRFEIGIHPNFLPGSSHGKKDAEIMAHVLNIAPQAKAMRTHALVQSSPMLAGVVADTHIETDVSLFLPFHQMLAPTRIYFEASGRPLVRLPYFWEDDVAACWPGWSWATVPEDAPGQLRIYNFHPIHVALNMATMTDYGRLKAELKGRPLTSLTAAECVPFANRGGGDSNLSGAPGGHEWSALPAHFRHHQNLSGGLMRVAVIGRTKALLSAARAVRAAGHDVPVVWTCSAEAFYGVDEEAFKALADELGADFVNDVAINSAGNAARLATYRCDIAISVNWLTVIKAEVLGLFPHGVLNAHAGDLPRYRGNACANWAILMGEPQIAVCVHQMAPQLDAGPVIVKRLLPLTDEVDMTEVCRWLDAEIPQMFVEVVGQFAAGTARPVAQPTDEAVALRTYPRRPEDSRIDWSWPVQRILRMVRASAKPYSGAYGFLEGIKKATIWRAVEVRHPGECVAVPGQVCYMLDGDPVIACGDGVIRLLKVGLEGAAGDAEAKATICRSLRNRLM